MNSVCRHLAAEVPVRLRKEVRTADFERGAWHLRDADGSFLGAFDFFIASAPPLQSARLLNPVAPLRQQAESVRMRGCWAAMATFARPLGLPFDGAFVHDSLLSWVARNDSKPGREGQPESWVLHASAEWTEEHVDGEADAILPLLLDAFWHATSLRPQVPQHAASHRWRYAIPLEPLDTRCLFDSEFRAGACGDWCSGPRVEGAFLSGMAVADRVLAGQP
jgi:predicted NAD/FAD-dependent oxidoreductase